VARLLSSWGAWLGAALALAACKPEPVKPPPGPSATAKSYAMRGVLKGVTATHTSKSLLIQHEAVDDFVGDSGAVVGMDAMTMPFTPAPALDVAALKAGDKLAFTTVVDWAVPRIQVTAVTVLPPETALVFGKASPTGGTSPSSPGTPDAGPRR
jgi:Cu/Ag efflux protein CusF